MSENSDLLKCATDVVVAYVMKNALKPTEVAKILVDVYIKLKEINGISSENIRDLIIPAVPVLDSVHPDYIICLEDGKKLKMLKRHLRTIYNMSVEEYKRKWGLPLDYPIVARNYAARRSVLAKEIGLGKKRDNSPKVTLRVMS